MLSLRTPQVVAGSQKHATLAFTQVSQFDPRRESRDYPTAS